MGGGPVASQASAGATWQGRTIALLPAQKMQKSLNRAAVLHREFGDWIIRSLGNSIGTSQGSLHHAA